VQDEDVSGARLKARYALRECIGLMVMAVALFWPAGRLSWWQAWAALAVMAAWTAGMAAIVLHGHPDLLAERLGPRRGAKRWDTAILSLVGVLQLARYVLAGLDQRFGWTGALPLAAQLAALAACILGQALTVWATAANRFFSQVARLQPERGHAVVTGGPYQFLRHPGYAGWLAYELAVPLLLGSWPAGLISLVTAGLVVLRTALEDRMLQAELAGYATYARRVRFRLVPGIW